MLSVALDYHLKHGEIVINAKLNKLALNVHSSMSDNWKLELFEYLVKLVITTMTNEKFLLTTFKRLKAQIC